MAEPGEVDINPLAGDNADARADSDAAAESEQQQQQQQQQKQKATGTSTSTATGGDTQIVSHPTATAKGGDIKIENNPEIHIDIDLKAIADAISRLVAMTNQNQQSHQNQQVQQQNEQTQKQLQAIQQKIAVLQKDVVALAQSRQGPQPNVAHTIRARHSNKVLAVESTATGARVVQQTYQPNNTAQQWRFTRCTQAPPSNEYYYVQNVQSGLYWMVTNPAQDTCDLTQAAFGAGAARRRFLVPYTNWWTRIIVRTTGAAITVRGGGQADGVPVFIRTDHHNAHQQQFMVVPIV